MLSTGDLASLLTGWMSLGYSIWSYTPQLILNFRTKPRTGGPTFILLLVWLAGDGGTLAGLYIGGGLLTQIVSAIWFAVSDILLMSQMAYFRGYIPGTRRRRERKEGAHGAVGALATRAGIGRYRPRDQTHSEGGERDLELGKVASRREKSERRARRERRRRRRNGFVELAPGKKEKRARQRASDEKKEREGCLETLFGRYNNLTQSICLVIVTLIMIGIWIGLDFINRDTSSPVSLAEPPTKDGKMVSVKLAVGFALGWIGTFMYNAPRWFQLFFTIHNRSTAGVEPWLFVTLLLQNFTLLASILSASLEGSYLYAQSPYLANICLAISADILFLFLHLIFKGNPTKELERPWTDPSYFNEKDLLLPTLAADRDTLHRTALTRRRASYVEQARGYANKHDQLPPHLQQSQAEHLRAREKELRQASDRLDQHVAASKDHRRMRAHAEASASSGEEEERQMEEASNARRAAEREGARGAWEKTYNSFAGASDSGSGSELSGEEDARRLMGRDSVPNRTLSSSSRHARR